MQRHGCNRRGAVQWATSTWCWPGCAWREAEVEVLPRPYRRAQSSAVLPCRPAGHGHDRHPEGPGVLYRKGRSACSSARRAIATTCGFQPGPRHAECRCAQGKLAASNGEEQQGTEPLLSRPSWSRIQPVHNRQLRGNTPCAWRLDDNPNARPLLTLSRRCWNRPQQFQRLYGACAAAGEHQDALRSWPMRGLCLQALGLDSGQGRCFHQIGRCKGVCCGQTQAAPPAPGTGAGRAKTSRLALRRAGASARGGFRSPRYNVRLFDQWSCPWPPCRDDEALAEALAQPRRWPRPGRPCPPAGGAPGRARPDGPEPAALAALRLMPPRAIRAAARRSPGPRAGRRPALRAGVPGCLAAHLEGASLRGRPFNLAHSAHQQPRRKGTTPAATTRLAVNTQARKSSSSRHNAKPTIFKIHARHGRAPVQTPDASAWVTRKGLKPPVSAQRRGETPHRAANPATCAGRRSSAADVCRNNGDGGHLVILAADGAAGPLQQADAGGRHHQFGEGMAARLRSHSARASSTGSAGGLNGSLAMNTVSHSAPVQDPHRRTASAEITEGWPA